MKCGELQTLMSLRRKKRKGLQGGTEMKRDELQVEEDWNQIGQNSFEHLVKI